MKSMSIQLVVVLLYVLLAALSRASYRTWRYQAMAEAKFRKAGWPRSSKALIRHKNFSGTGLALSSANKARKITRKGTWHAFS